MNWINGKKTYLCAAAGAVVVGAHMLGWLGADSANTLLGLLGAGGIASLKHAVAKGASS